ncbi:MAG: hypothetical protein JEZ00_18345 [Anaerolineaceae bacterium]|nr:hypothetical protein [Anaerolineaceae bacterium]
MDVVYAYEWFTPWINAGRSVVNAGVYALGQYGNSYTFYENTSTTVDGNQVNSFRAAALFEILDMLYDELDISLLSSNWIINDVLSDVIGSRTPWTYWNTVHIRDNINTSKILEAAPHEFGHVLYNLNHSGKLHYDTDDWMDYLHNHGVCDNFGTQFGHYEGFAHAFANLFWRHHAQRFGQSDYSTPNKQCTTSGIALEGNVNEFYCYAFAGIPMERPPNSLNAWTTGLIGANKYAFPPTMSLFQIVNNHLTEDLNQMWIHSMRSMLGGTNNGVPTFCSSRRFRYLVMDTMLSSSDTFPSEFKNVDSLPGKSNIVNTTPSAGSIQVEFTSAEYVNSYEVIVQPVGQSETAYAVSESQYGLETLTHSVPASNCATVKLSVKTYNEHGSTQGDIIEVDAACLITKPVINNVACSYFPPRDAITLPLVPPYEYDENDTDDNDDNFLTEIPASPGGFNIEVKYTPSPQADEHRYALVRTGFSTEYGLWSAYPDNTIRFIINSTEMGSSPKVAVQAKKGSHKVTSAYKLIQYPANSLVMSTIRKVYFRERLL